MPMRIEKGTRVYYTGDMANFPSYGTVLRCYSATRYTPETVDIAFDEQTFEGDVMRVARRVPVSNFSAGPGCRFWLARDWDARKRAVLAQLRERAGLTA